jgi:DNA-binding response OmpR family regulator
MLSNLEIDVVSAQSGEEAIDLFLQNEFALLLLDVLMGGISGFETTSRIRALDHDNNDVPIIFVTATNTDATNIFEGYEAGAVNYLLKPVDKSTLRSKVNVFCRLHTQRDLIQTQLDEIKRKNDELEKHLAEIDVLRGLVPICASCKNVRDDTGYWHSIEQYLTEHSDAKLTHSICPTCTETLYPGLLDKTS